MPATHDCPTCGSPLPAEAPEGLCPKCLLQAGMGKTSEPPALSTDGSGTKMPGNSLTSNEPEPEAMISRPPFRVRYFGDYELKAEIARGGMGVVYRGWQVSLDRPVALKMILSDDPDDDTLKRFRQEAESAANLDHPNIVQVYEVGRHEGQHFISMKLIDGRSLKDELPRFRKDVRAAAQLMATVARAVHHAHQRGVLHRDLKPQNVLVDRDGQPHVTDFGLAKRIDAGREVTQAGAWFGTPQYMPPEQAAGEFKGLTTAADIYSLGAIFYTLLTGDPPFQGAYPAILHRITEDEPARPRSLDPRVDPDLETICLKCLEKDRSRRYPTAAELADDLDRWHKGEPITARPVSRWERAWKWVRRKPAIAALSAAVLLIGLVGLAGVFWQWNVAVKANTALKGALRQAQQNAYVARQNAYVAHISLAQRDWDGTSVAHARELLENPDEAEFRGFEWHYLKRLYYPELLTLRGHTFGVLGVSFSPDGKQLASATQDGTVKLWDAASGQKLFTLNGQPDDGKQHDGRHLDLPPPTAVFDVAFSPDGKQLASASQDRTAKLWDTATGQELLTLKGHTSLVHGVAFSPDGKRLASASWDQTVKLWDAATGQELLTLRGHTEFVNGVAFSPDGKRLASASRDQTVKLWDASTGQELLTLKGHTEEVTGVAFSPDGKQLASASSDHTVRLWDAASGQELRALKGHTEEVTGVAFSPDGKQLASASHDQTVKLWDVTTGQALLTFKGHTAWVNGVAFSPDGERLASASHDQTVKLWDATGGQEPLTLEGHTSKVAGVSFSPDGKRIASASLDKTVKLWDADTGQVLLTLKGHTESVKSVAFSPDGKRLATASDDRTVKLWDADTGRELLTLKGHTANVYGVSFSPDGKRIASASWEEVKLWDADTGQVLLTLKGHTYYVNSVAFSPDGRRIASAGGEDHTVKLWNADTGQELLTLKGHTNIVTGVSFSPDSKRLASANWDGTVKLWDVANGQDLITLTGHTSTLLGVAFSPDGKRLASASTDHTVKLWDTASGQELLTLTGHTEDVTGVAFSPDGKRLASASGDDTVKIWRGDER
jgi:WD40 repeat protein/predicted Ser/Thr protein kinase